MGQNEAVSKGKVKIEKQGTPGQPDYKVVLSCCSKETHPFVLKVCGLLIASLPISVFFGESGLIFAGVVVVSYFPLGFGLQEFFPNRRLSITLDSKGIRFYEGVKVESATPYHLISDIVVEGLLNNFSVYAVLADDSKSLLEGIHERRDADQVKTIIDEFLLDRCWEGTTIGQPENRFIGDTKVEQRGAPGLSNHALILRRPDDRMVRWALLGFRCIFCMIPGIATGSGSLFVLWTCVILAALRLNGYSLLAHIYSLLNSGDGTLVFDSKGLFESVDGLTLKPTRIKHDQIGDILIKTVGSGESTHFALVASSINGEKLLVNLIEGRQEAEEFKTVIKKFLLAVKVDQGLPYHQWLGQKLLDEKGFRRPDEDSPWLLRGCTRAGFSVCLHLDPKQEEGRLEIENHHIPKSLYCSRRSSPAINEVTSWEEQKTGDLRFDERVLVEVPQYNARVTAWLNFQQRQRVQSLLAKPVDNLRIDKGVVQFTTRHPARHQGWTDLSVLQKIFDAVDQLRTSEDLVAELVHNVRSDPIAEVRIQNLRALLEHDYKRGLSICQELVECSHTTDRKLRVFDTRQLEAEDEEFLRNLFSDEEAEKRVEAVTKLAATDKPQALLLLETLLERFGVVEISGAALACGEKGIVLLGLLLDLKIRKELRIQALEQCALLWNNQEASKQVVRCLTNADTLIADRALQIVTRRGPTEGVAYFESLEHHPIQEASDDNRILFAAMYAHAEPVVAQWRLVSLLSDESSEVREAAARAFATVWEKHPTSPIPKRHLRPLLTDSVPAIRTTSARAFGAHGVIEDIEYLLPLTRRAFVKPGVAEVARKAIEDIRSRLAVEGDHGQVSVVSADAIPKEAGAVSIDHEGGKVSIDDEAAKMSDAERGQVSIDHEGGKVSIDDEAAKMTDPERGQVSIDHEGGKVSLDDEAAKMNDAERGQVSIDP